jgi:probable HAF family extracellular repeat protein
MAGTITDLGTLGGDRSRAFGLNASGQVVGTSTDASGQGFAFLYTPGSGMVNLGTLGGSGGVVANGINNSGQVVGISSTADGFGHAFLYTPGSGMTDLGTLGGSSSQAFGINASGQVVGTAMTAGGVNNAFLYTPGSGMTNISPDDALSTATGINASGQVTGAALTPGNASSDAYLYTPGSGMTDIGTLGGPITSPFAINDSAQITGTSTLNSDSNSPADAFLYTPGGSMVDLGNFGGGLSVGRGINTFGQVVGYTADANGVEYAFLYANGAMIDLNTLLPANSDWFLADAFGINDSDEIVGSGYTGDGEQHAFELDVSDVFAPEPSSWILAGLGAVLFGMRKRLSAA